MKALPFWRTNFSYITKTPSIQKPRESTTPILLFPDHRAVCPHFRLFLLFLLQTCHSRPSVSGFTGLVSSILFPLTWPLSVARAHLTFPMKSVNGLAPLWYVNAAPRLALPFIYTCRNLSSRNLSHHPPRHGWLRMRTTEGVVLYNW